MDTAQHQFSSNAARIYLKKEETAAVTFRPCLSISGCDDSCKVVLAARAEQQCKIHIAVQDTFVGVQPTTKETGRRKAQATDTRMNSEPECLFCFKLNSVV